MSLMNLAIAIILIIILFKIQKAIIKTIIKIAILLLILPYVGYALVEIGTIIDPVGLGADNLIANSFIEIGNFFISLNVFDMKY